MFFEIVLTVLLVLTFLNFVCAIVLLKALGRLLVLLSEKRATKPEQIQETGLLDV